MNILLLGSGGREHAIAWKVSKSKNLNKLFIAPGNAGTSLIGENINLNTGNFEEIEEFIKIKKINILIVGPENIIVKGIYDYLKPKFNDLVIIAPSKEASLLEGSKKFAKAFMQRNHIPTAKYKSFQQHELKEAFRYLESMEPPYVIKADGLAGGKGVVILDTIDEAKIEIKNMLEGKKFGKASEEILIEEFMSGVELSVFILTNGLDYKLLPCAKDYKRIGEGDKGLNTGGMGAVSPVPFVNSEYLNKIDETIIKPTIEGLKKENINYTGFIFFGLIDVEGTPKVIEYNVRLGDPETQVILPRIESDLVEILKKINTNEFKSFDLKIKNNYCTSVILTSNGYPEKYKIGYQINGLDSFTENDLLFHAGTKINKNKITTSGGRVLAVSSYGENLKKSINKVYKKVDKIYFDGMYFRKDIGLDLIIK